MLVSVGTLKAKTKADRILESQSKLAKENRSQSQRFILAAFAQQAIVTSKDLQKSWRFSRNPASPTHAVIRIQSTNSCNASILKLQFPYARRLQ